MLNYICVASVIYGLYLIPVRECTRKNVCRSLKDYRTIQQNPNCWYNPDVGASPGQIAMRYGYPFESHQITTEDGYIVSLYRVPHNGTGDGRERPPVFLQHGIASDATSWMLEGSKSSVFVFANNGYDVWFPSSRGSTESSKHLRYTLYDPKYWNFSFHELAIYDVPAMLEFIVSKTGQKVIYVGHSMGGTMSFVYASVRPQHAIVYLKSIIALAPVVYTDHVNPLVKPVAAFRQLIWKVLTSAGLYGIGPNIESKLDVLHRLCSTLFIELCTTVYRLVSGSNPEEALAETFPIFARTFPGAVSLKTLLHYAQIAAMTRRFQFFDYGPTLNLEYYNSSRPPEYPLSQIKVPVHLFYGKNDGFADEKDVLYLYDKLETEKTVMEVFGFSHFNFIAAKRSFELYQMLLNYMGKY